MTILSMWCHPIKGFTPEQMDQVELVAGGYFPNDRMFVVEDGPSGFDQESPQHLSKMKFVVLARSSKLANFVTKYIDDQNVLEFYERENGYRCAFDMTSQKGFDELADWLSTRIGDEFAGPLRVLSAPKNHRFMDYASGYVSLINGKSVEALANAIDKDISVQRFRGNIVFDAPAWEEDNWVQGQLLQVGNARLEVLIPTVRCKATHANPVSAEYDTDTVPLLMKHFNRRTMGVYARIVQSGCVAVGDEVQAI